MQIVSYYSYTFFYRSLGCNSHAIWRINHHKPPLQYTLWRSYAVVNKLDSSPVTYYYNNNNNYYYFYPRYI